MSVRSPAPNRQQLAVAFRDPETRIAFEALFRQVAALTAQLGPPLVINETPVAAIAPHLFTIPITTPAGTYYMLVSDAP